MTMRLLDRSPFSPEPSEFLVRDQRVRVRANQIILWVTLTLKRITSADPSAVPFPVILDTGNSHTFAIQERHLIDWAGIRPDVLALLSRVRDRGQLIPLHAAGIWIHPNERGSRNRLAEQEPYSLNAPRGIAVYPGDFPRLPLLGLRAIADSRLILMVDGTRREATLRTAYKWWPFS